MSIQVTSPKPLRFDFQSRNIANVGSAFSDGELLAEILVNKDEIFRTVFVCITQGSATDFKYTIEAVKNGEIVWQFENGNDAGGTTNETLVRFAVAKDWNATQGTSTGTSGIFPVGPNTPQCLNPLFVGLTSALTSNGTPFAVTKFMADCDSIRIRKTEAINMINGTQIVFAVLSEMAA